MSDDLYVGPSVLAPGAPDRPDRLARWLLWPLIVFFCLAIVVFYVLFSAERIDGNSMYPALHDQDRVLHTRSYERPARGDIIVFDADPRPDVRDDVVKRVIGLPGDTVEIRDDIALVNGVVEDTSDLVLMRGSGEYREPLAVPEGQLYVMGDNRPISLDSRFVGTVAVDSVRGKAVYIFSPVNRIGAVR